VRLQTTAGNRSLKYDDKNYSSLGSDWWVHHGLGMGTVDGRWRIFARDLQADLQAGQPDANILAVDYICFHITGTGRVDDIRLSQSNRDGDADGLSDFEEVNTIGTDPDLADSDVDGLNDGDELDFWGSDWNADMDGDGLINILDPDADGDGTLDGDGL
jgi:hypothetical protein